MSSMNNQNPKPSEKVSYNCKHICWLIGVGQGLRCGASGGVKYQVDGTLVKSLKARQNQGKRMNKHKFTPNNA